uniref:Uncharacterized protein n=1 Tax=mine drainage metagenome TaxID=410659 RepID=E6QCS9_9ZZZZ
MRFLRVINRESLLVKEVSLCLKKLYGMT